MLLPRGIGVSDSPTTPGMAALSTFMSPHSSGLPQALPQNNTSFCDVHITRYEEAYCLCLQLFPHCLTIVLTTHTKKYPPLGKAGQTQAHTFFFPFSLDPRTQILVLKTQEGKSSQNNLKIPLALEKSPPSLLDPPFSRCPRQDGRGVRVEEFLVYRHAMRGGATLTRASTVCTGYQLLRPPTLLVHVGAPQAEVTVVIGNDCPIWSFLGCGNIFLKIQCQAEVSLHWPLFSYWCG